MLVAKPGLELLSSKSCSIEVAHIFVLGIEVMGTNQHLVGQVMAGATVVAEMVDDGISSGCRSAHGCGNSGVVQYATFRTKVFNARVPYYVALVLTRTGWDRLKAA